MPKHPGSITFTITTRIDLSEIGQDDMGVIFQYLKKSFEKAWFEELNSEFKRQLEGKESSNKTLGLLKPLSIESGENSDANPKR
jgi:hypothetical protein